MRRAAAIVLCTLVAVASNAQERAAPHGPDLRQGDIEHRYPATRQRPVDFTVTSAGIVLVPLAGGLYVAGLNGWLIAPGPKPIVSAASSGAELYLLRDAGEEVHLVRKPAPFAQSGETTIARLPAGRYRLASGSTGDVWIWGRQSDGRWNVLQHRNAVLLPIYESKVPITAVGVASDDAAVIAIGRVVTLMRRGQEPVAMLISPSLVRGLAVGPRGHLYIAGSDSVAEAGPGGRLIPVHQLSGYLRVRGSSVYVLDRDRSRVVQLTPPAEQVAR